MRQIVCHLADAEAVGVMRLRSVAAEDNPTLMGYDQDAWANSLDYGRRKISKALETFRQLRGENHEMLKGLAEEAFERVGTHSSAGKRSLLDLVRGDAEHVENHVRQIQGVRAAYREQRAKKQATD